jgi:hypothetical protein
VPDSVAATFTCDVRELRSGKNRDHLRYPSDLTGDKWAYVEPLIPPAKRGHAADGHAGGHDRWRTPEDGLNGALASDSIFRMMYVCAKSASH